MATLNSLAAPAPTLLSLTAVGDTAGSGILLTWEVPNDQTFFGVELWASLTNNRESAVLVEAGPILGSSYLYVADAGTARYFWVRAVNVYNVANGAWLPSSATGGVFASVSAVETKDIAPNAVSISAFGFSGAILTGIDMATSQSVLAFTLSNTKDTPLPISLQHYCRQTYTAGVKDTRWVLALFTAPSTYTVIYDTGTLEFGDELPAVSMAYQIPANTDKTFVLFWWAEDNTVSITNRTFSFIGLVR